MRYPNEASEEFSSHMDLMRKEACERFDKMIPEQQIGFEEVVRRHHRKVRDEIECFVLK